MKDKVEIAKIIVKMGNTKVALTLQEAKELQEILNKTFGEVKTVYVPSTPYYINYPYKWTYPNWYVTHCNDNSTQNIGTLTCSIASTANI